MNTKFPITIDLPELKEGETYVGAIIRADGSGHCIILMPDRPEKTMAWKQAIAYAKKAGGELPDRVEGALLYPQRDALEIESGWYWTREQYAGSDAYAWLQSFYNGLQISDRKDDAYRVVLVRRVAIEMS